MLDSIWKYCIIYQKALTFEFLNSDLNIGMEVVIEIVNYIKTRLLKPRSFLLLTLNSVRVLQYVRNSSFTHLLMGELQRKIITNHA